MACTQTLDGLYLDCESSMGGIKKIYVARYEDVLDTPLDEKNDTITGITMANEAKFKPYQFRKQTGSMTSTLNVDETTGLNYVSTELNLVFTKMETNKRMQIAALSVGQLAVIVEDCNGVFYYLGKDDYVSASAGGAQTGTAKTDGNNYTLTLKDESKTYPYIIKDSTVVDKVVDKDVDKE